MILKNDYIVNLLNNAIKEYNEDLENKDSRILLVDEKLKEISDDELVKIKRLSFGFENMTRTELEDTMEEMSVLLSKMNLNSFYLSVKNLENQSSLSIDTAFLNSLNNDIKEIGIVGIDFSKQSSDIFSRFKDLKFLGLDKANLIDLQIFSKLSSNVGLSVCDNPLEDDIKEEIVDEIIKRKGLFSFGKTEGIYNKIAFALYRGNMEIDLTNLDIPEGQVDKIVDILNKLDGFNFILNESAFNKLNSSNQKLNDNITINKLIVSSTSELSLGYLESHPNIETIQIIDYENREYDGQEEPYTREEFIRIKQEINKIKEQVKMPDDNDKDREKKIFMQVYTILGKKINYDFHAISEEGEKDKRLQATCRNLIGGLLEDKSVCAGYADILKNILSEFGIKAKYICRKPEDIEIFAKRNGYDEEVEYDEENEFYDQIEREKLDMKEFVQRLGYQDKCSHAWNLVELDGKKYLCDLTWDADSIKCEHYPLDYCCTSSYDFYFEPKYSMTHDMFEMKDEVDISEFTNEEQLRFLGYSEEEINQKLYGGIDELIELLEENVNQRKLESCVCSISSEIKASDFDGIENSFTKEKEKKDNDKEC